MPDPPPSQAFPSNLKSQISSNFKLFSNLKFRVFLPYPRGRSCMAARRLFSCNSTKIRGRLCPCLCGKGRIFLNRSERVKQALARPNRSSARRLGNPTCQQPIAKHVFTSIDHANSQGARVWERPVPNRTRRPKGSRRNKLTFWRERRAGTCEAPRRRRCRTSSRSGNNADTRPSPPRPSELRPAGLQQNAKFISARALRSPTSAVAVQVKMGLVNRRVRRPGLESSLQASLTRYRLSLNSEPGSSEDE